MKLVNITALIAASIPVSAREVYSRWWIHAWAKWNALLCWAKPVAPLLLFGLSVILGWMIIDRIDSLRQAWRKRWNS